MTTKKNNDKAQDKKIRISDIKKEKKKLILYSEIMKPKFKEGV